VTAFDVVVAGGGNAGVTAALSASEHGARVLLAERAPKWQRGGNSRHTRNIRYAHERPDRWAASAYPAESFLSDLAAVTDRADQALAQLVVAHSRDLPAWMESNGVKWQSPLRGTLHLETNRFFLGGGRAMLNSYYRTARFAKIAVSYSTSVTALKIDGGGCAAVEVERDGRRELVETKALVVASGGLEANHAWLQETWGPGAENFIVRGTPHNDGSLLLAVLDAGAMPTGSNLFHCIAVDARSPRYDGGIVTRVDSVPFGVMLNRRGERFYDEGEEAWPKRYAVWGQLIARQPDQIAYSIFDQKAWGLFIPPAYPPLTADTLSSLLQQIDIDREQAARTIAHYNSAVEDARPFDSTRKDGRIARGVAPPRSNWARTISEPPFYAYPLAPGITFTYWGLKVNERSQVVQSDGEPFRNIFAAGETMAGNILTSGYLAGFGLTIGSVFGRIAGEEAAAVAR
jgi:tricarballylate dehydrogenase